MATSLDDVLNEEKPQAPLEPEAPAEPSEPAAEPDKPERPTSRRAEHRKVEFAAQGRDPETGKFLAKEPPVTEPEKPVAAAPAEPAKTPETPAAPPAQPPLTERERAFLAKANDEARKRQALEQQIGAKPAEPPKAFWDDPEGALKKHREEMAQQNLNTRLHTAELIARSRYPDFEEKVGKFAEIVQQNPALAPMWLNSPDPAEFAYRTAKNHMELQQAGSLDKLRSEIETRARADERSKVEAEFKKKQEDLEKQRAALTPSLSDVRGATSSKAAPVWGGPTPLDDILGGKD